MTIKTKAILALVLVALGYTILNVATRLMDQGLEPMTQVYVRIGVGFLLSLLLFRNKIRVQQLLKLPKRDWILLLIMGTVAYSIAVYFITIGALNASLLNVSIVYSTIGFFVYFYSIIFLKSKFNPVVLSLIAVTFVGLVFIAGKSFVPNINTFGLGEIYVLIAAALMGLFSIGRKLLSKDLNNQEITVLVMLIASSSGFLLALIKGEALPQLASFTTPVLVGVAIGALLNITSNFFESYAFEHIDVVLGNQVLLLEALFSVIIGVLFYHEMVTFPELVGATLVLTSVYWSNKIL